jgi:16S rRNA (adenine1518-N6/adenine1519-N6)-dimethyltransferase
MSAMSEDPREVLARFGLRAKKSWSQNFLLDGRVHEAIVAATVRADDEWVLEIGAGLGTLTTRLADAVPRGRVLAVEREADMLSVLGVELAGRGNVEVIAADALTLDHAGLAARAGRPLAVAGNLPYQIAAPLIFGLLAARRHLTRIVIMLQKEMADRILAAPGTRAYGALGVMVAAYAAPRRVCRVAAGAFHPRPQVDSMVLELTPEVGGAPRAAIGDEGRFSEVVHAAFGQRRKTLRNALRARYDESAVDAALATAGIDGGRRGETLALDEFAALATAIG